MPLRISDLARSILSWRNSGCVSTSLKIPSTSPVFSFSAENETEPLDSPILHSTEAAMFSQFFVELVASRVMGAARTHDGAGDRSDADLVRGFEQVTRAYPDRSADNRQLVIFE